ncbi:MAG: ABC-three component system middle component 1 [Candidatus Omnitrophota bacterium]
MKLKDIESAILKILDSFYIIQQDELIEELLSYAPDELIHKKVMRIQRNNKNTKYKTDNLKTLLIVELEDQSYLKMTLDWVVLVKESLLDPQTADIYLFLIFSSDVSIEECLRIESTEQFCRKYVLLPNEDISEFVNRTFLQRLINTTDTIEGKDPLESAFLKTSEKHNWLTPEMQETWKKAFSNLSGSELVEELLKDEELA